MVNRDKEIPFTRVWFWFFWILWLWSFGSFGYCDYKCHNLSQRTAVEKVKEENKRSYILTEITRRRLKSNQKKKEQTVNAWTMWLYFSMIYWLKEEHFSSKCLQRPKPGIVIRYIYISKIIIIIKLPSVGELRNNFTWIEERN